MIASLALYTASSLAPAPVSATSGQSARGPWESSAWEGELRRRPQGR